MASNGAGGAAAAAGDALDKGKVVAASDILLPIANVDRIARKVVPADCKVGKGAVQLIQECASEFIAFVTLDTANAMNKDKRKTLLEGDFIASLDRLGFEEFHPFLSLFLEKIRAEREEKRAQSGRKREAAAASSEPAKRPRTG